MSALPRRQSWLTGKKKNLQIGKNSSVSDTLFIVVTEKKCAGEQAMDLD